MFFELLCLLIAPNVAGLTLLDIPSPNCHLVKNARLGQYLDCDGPLKVASGLKAKVVVTEDSGAFGVFPEELKAGQSFGVYLKDKHDLFKQVSASFNLTASDGTKTEKTEIKVLFDDRPVDMLEFDSREFVVHVSNPITEGILKKFKVLNSESTQPTMFQYDLEGAFNEFFSIEPADPDLILLRARGCDMLCPSLPENFPLILRITDGNRLPSNILLNIVMLWDTATVFDSIKVNLREKSSNFEEVVRAHFDDTVTLSYELADHSDVFDIDSRFGILTVKNSTLLTIAKYGSHIELTVLLYKDDNKWGEQHITVVLEPDNPAKLQLSDYHFKIDGKSRIVGEIRVKNGDKADYFMNGDGNNFLLNQKSGILEYGGRQSRDDKVYQLQITAKAGDFLDTAMATVIVAGLGSESPKFSDKLATITVPIDHITALQIYRFEAEDADSDANLFYNMTSVRCYSSPECEEYFTLNEDGTLLLKGTSVPLSVVQIEVEVQDLQYPAESTDKKNLVITFVKDTKITYTTINTTMSTEKVQYFEGYSNTDDALIGQVEVQEGADVTIRSDVDRFTVNNKGEIPLKKAVNEQMYGSPIPAVVTVTQSDVKKEIPEVIRINVKEVTHVTVTSPDVKLFEDADVDTFVADLGTEATTVKLESSSTALLNALTVSQGTVRTKESLYGISGIHKLNVMVEEEVVATIVIEIVPVSHSNPSFSALNPIVLYEGEKAKIMVESTSKESPLQYSASSDSIKIDESTGETTVLDVDDDEIVTITATDGKHKIQYEVEVRKEKDTVTKSLKCVDDKITLQISKKIQPDTVLGTVNVEGADYSTKFTLHESYGIFEIDDDGQLSTVNEYDGDSKVFELNVEVSSTDSRVECQVNVQFLSKIEQTLEFTRPRHEVVVYGNSNVGSKVVQLNVKNSFAANDVFYDIKKTYYENREVMDNIFEVNSLNGEVRMVKSVANYTNGYFQLHVMARRGKQTADTSVIIWVCRDDDISRIVVKMPPRTLSAEVVIKALRDLAEVTDSKTILAGINYYVVNGVPLNNGTVLKVLFVKGNRIIAPNLLKKRIEPQYDVMNQAENRITFERALLTSTQPLGMIVVIFLCVLLVGMAILLCCRFHYQHRYKVELKQFRKLSDNNIISNTSTTGSHRPRANTSSTGTDIMEKVSVKSDKSEVQQVSMQL
ncbi:unnamed protein product [Bursaphelenchus okinawaensis]|uniref:Cadherin domain-containing protein n=1 Tax=Bursaphelenchus okinawaensis TaxID=465554 RepID=A0A811K602_9BILA|nr:unnamed protein product [Bursaphelenchus okinawaensis]CAG9093501.1 unnamed protein product [Bursaphelenchus okinawaensis]